MIEATKVLEKIYKMIDEADLPPDDELRTEIEMKQAELLDNVYQELYDFIVKER
jgi:hypothetical protein